MVARAAADEETPGSPERTTSSVSLPKATLAWIDWFIRTHGEELDYRSRVDFILSAIRTQKDQDMARLLQMRAVERESAVDWSDPPQGR